MIPWLACAAGLLFGRGFAQEPEESLRHLPTPALDAAEATARCPQDVDTLLQVLLRELSLHADRDGSNEDAANQHLRLQMAFFSKAQKELERNILAAGEQIDKDIRNCPRAANQKGERVYDPACVEAAEQRGRRQRIEAVDHYLSSIHHLWPAYLDSTRRIIAETRNGKWRIVLRVATDIATITQTAAEFAR